MSGSVDAPVIIVRCPNQSPATLNLQTDMKQQPVDQPTSPIFTDSKLDSAESMDHKLSSPQVSQCSMHAAGVNR